MACYGERLLPLYRFDTASGRWRHQGGLIEPPLRLADVHYDADGRMVYPTHHDRSDETELDHYLQSARQLLQSLPRPQLPEHVAGLSADFEHLRWFGLSTESVQR